jgi:hypothetical protein
LEEVVEHIHETSTVIAIAEKISFNSTHVIQKNKGNYLRHCVKPFLSVSKCSTRQKNRN